MADPQNPNLPNKATPSQADIDAAMRAAQEAVSGLTSNPQPPAPPPKAKLDANDPNASIDDLMAQAMAEQAADGGSSADAALKAAKDAIASLGDLTSMSSPAPSKPAPKPESQPEPEPEPAEAAAPPPGDPFVPPELQSLSPDAKGQLKAIDLLSDVNLDVKIELGRTRMLVDDVLRLGPGAVVELDKLAGDPVDIFVNERHIARGEVLVVNDNFCVRISEILNQRKDSAKA